MSNDTVTPQPQNDGWASYRPEMFDPNKYNLQGCLDGKVAQTAYEQFREMVDTLKAKAEKESATNPDGTKKPTRLEKFASEADYEELGFAKGTEYVMPKLRTVFFNLATTNPELFAVFLFEMRALMSGDVKAMADVVLPEVLSTVAQTDETSAEDDEETFALRNEAYGLRKGLQSLLKFAEEMPTMFSNIDALQVPKVEKNTRGGISKVFDLPQVPGTRNPRSDSDENATKSVKTSHVQFTVNGAKLPAGTSLAKCAFLASTEDAVYTPTDLELALSKVGKKWAEDFSVEMPNGSKVVGKVLPKKN